MHPEWPDSPCVCSQVMDRDEVKRNAQTVMDKSNKKSKRTKGSKSSGARAPMH